MTNVIELAKQAWIDLMPPDMNYRSPYYACTPDELEVFAGLVRNAALEQAKQLCEARAMSVASRCGYPEGLKVGAQGCAAAIESLKEPTP